MYICISSLKSDRIVKNMGKLAVLNWNFRMVGFM
jgi:hypothetical protein